MLCDSLATNVVNSLKVTSLRGNVAFCKVERRSEKNNGSIATEKDGNIANIQRSINKVLKDQDPDCKKE